MRRPHTLLFPGLLALTLLTASLLAGSLARAAQAAVGLGSADSFAVLAGSTITNALVRAVVAEAHSLTPTSPWLPRSTHCGVRFEVTTGVGLAPVSPTTHEFPLKSALYAAFRRIRLPQRFVTA